ncbi:pyruvate formate lyase activating enzyme, putative [Talaromyces stipitatus ATCC 10500]|uniref:Pyruvate formate lyase activating enzyme, putative n=1 Tax=Talaromyces stipitatus (strain ATCC 10500 / CBS 375.48 / QM 6759 / NRRL 1006) TaxID=441959 RepID=B8MRF2_TALSN|nr:pyruvate formate lyase activating enzyme, putative [Talaromyces stipitatus ATCC 10500]EED13047.1 pyruvate formate lyase activating enzyme, putative [Talaromyces stipitatus ATCC 10500]
MSITRTGASLLSKRATTSSLLRPYRFQRRDPIIKRHLGIPPQYLLDDYIPRYQLLTPLQAAQKRSSAYSHLRKCNLCPHKCDINRYEKTGVCLIGATTAKVNVIAPHRGEEPCIQGNGFDLTPEELAEWMIKLQNVGGVHNINFVTPEHVVPQVALAILTAQEMGLKIPIVYNTSSFDSIESLKLMDGLVDIYLPDFKVWDPSTSKRLLKAENYADVAKESIKEMYRQVGDLSFTSDGIAKRGVLVRHLVMPGRIEEGREIVRWLAENVSRDLYVHVMEQYHPDAHVGKKKSRKRRQVGGEEEVEEVRYADINRAVMDEEVESVRKAAEDAGLWRFCEVSEQPGFHL